ncbi:MAG: hypothetical protein IPI90_10630 [Saprospiraceae bacterium]|nr:hypothetical protein [Candidatus Vicinibacter affinis]
MLKPSPKEILKKYWGFERIQINSGEVIESIIGSEMLCTHAYRRREISLLPGSGLKMEGCCVVISPLIALMQDQVNQLKLRGVTAGLFTQDCVVK